jgi:hypothetical protein
LHKYVGLYTFFYAEECGTIENTNHKTHKIHIPK